MQELSQITGLSTRDLRSTIQAERKRGALILSDTVHGYFLPENEKDVARFVHSMRQRASEILKVAEIAEKTAQARKEE